MAGRKGGGGSKIIVRMLPVEMSSHENTGTTFFSRTLTSQTVDLSVIINLEYKPLTDITVSLSVINLEYKPSIDITVSLSVINLEYKHLTDITVDFPSLSTQNINI